MYIVIYRYAAEQVVIDKNSLCGAVWIIDDTLCSITLKSRQRVNISAKKEVRVAVEEPGLREKRKNIIDI